MSADTHVALVQRVCRLIEDHLDEHLTLDDLGTVVAVSPAHLQRLFKRIAGISPSAYAAAKRLERLKSRLKETTVTAAVFEAGYGSSSRVYQQAAGQLGMTPGHYQKGGPAALIRFTLVGCALGRLLLAGTERGVCAIYLGDRDEPLVAELRREFHAAVLRQEDDGLAEWAEQVRNHLAGAMPHLDLPLDVRATAFQWRVWQHLRSIPAGQTQSYREVAEALGQPTAARAVARACATNPVCVVVPCHRVIRGNGGLGGYRWGLTRKEALLAREKTEAEQSASEAPDTKE